MTKEKTPALPTPSAPRPEDKPITNDELPSGRLQHDRN